jgi:hypothetical protein
VCVRPHDASPAVHYLGKCWKKKAWNGKALPAGTDPVSVHAGTTHAGINVTVGRTVYHLGSIAGTIHETLGNSTLQSADVYLYSNSGTQLGHATSDLNGNYAFTQLRPSSVGYVVCVSGLFAIGALVPATGWESRCHSATLWNGPGFAVPGSATRVTLTAGQQRSGIDITLDPAGGIAGTIYSGDSTGFPVLETVQVKAFTLSGRLVGSAPSSPGDASYTLPGLNPGTYVVCFDGRLATSGGSTPGFAPQCFDKVVWNGDA